MTTRDVAEALATVATIRLEMAIEALADGKALPDRERLALARELAARAEDLVYALERLVDGTRVFAERGEALDLLPLPSFGERGALRRPEREHLGRAEPTEPHRNEGLHATEALDVARGTRPTSTLPSSEAFPATGEYRVRPADPFELGRRTEIPEAWRFSLEAHAVAFLARRQAGEEAFEALVQRAWEAWCITNAARLGSGRGSEKLNASASTNLGSAHAYLTEVLEALAGAVGPWRSAG